MSEVFCPENWRELRAHPAAEVFPVMEGGDNQAMMDSLRRGYDRRQPIVLKDGLIVDGRNRHRLCVELYSQGDLRELPCFREMEPADGDLGEFVLRHNISRRHLKEYQKACAVVALKPWIKAESDGVSQANLTPGRPGKRQSYRVAHNEQLDSSPSNSDSHHPVTRQKLAAIAGVSEGTMERAETMQNRGGDALVRRVAAGEINLKDALALVGRKDGDKHARGKRPPERASRAAAAEASQQLRQHVGEQAKGRSPKRGAAPTCQTRLYSELGANTTEAGARTVVLSADPAEAAMEIAYHFDREGVEGLLYYLRRYLLAETVAYVLRTYGEEKINGSHATTYTLA